MAANAVGIQSPGASIAAEHFRGLLLDGPAVWPASIFA
jgi:hypothetical protein